MESAINAGLFALVTGTAHHAYSISACCARKLLLSDRYPTGTAEMVNSSEAISPNAAVHATPST